MFTLQSVAVSLALKLSVLPLMLDAEPVCKLIQFPDCALDPSMMSISPLFGQF